MKAVILAAGRGTRLRPLTDTTPKALLQVADKPILEHILLGIASALQGHPEGDPSGSPERAAGIREAALVTGHLAEQIENYFGVGERVGLRLSYFRQPEPTGSGPATLLAERYVGGEAFLLSFADILTSRENYSSLLRKFAANPCDALLGLNEVEDPWAGAAVYLDGDRVTDLIEKPPRGTSTTRWNNAGVMILTQCIFPALRALQPSERGERETPRAVAALIHDGHRILGVKFSGFWSDVGTVEELARLNHLASQGLLNL